MAGDALNFIRQFCKLRLKRYSVFNTHLEQSVGEHTANVAFIVMLILDDLYEECSDRYVVRYTILKRALLHDFVESYTGDVFGDFKKDHSKLKKALDGAGKEEVENFLRSAELGEYYSDIFAYDDERDPNPEIIKFADLLDRWLHCEAEVGMGNRDFFERKEKTYNELQEVMNNSARLYSSATAKRIMEGVRLSQILQQKGGENDDTT